MYAKRISRADINGMMDKPVSLIDIKQKTLVYSVINECRLQIVQTLSYFCANFLEKAVPGRF